MFSEHVSIYDRTSDMRNKRVTHVAVMTKTIAHKPY